MDKTTGVDPTNILLIIFHEINLTFVYQLYQLSVEC